jgi:phage gp36-like protein
MIYATVADMIDRFGKLEMIQLTDADNIPPAVVDEARVQVKLADAAAFVDGYIGQVYRLPLRGCAKPATAPGAAPEYVAPPVLTRITCDVARYYLHDDLAPENEVYRRYTAAVKELQTIVAGQAFLSCPWGGSPGELVASDALQATDTRYGFSPRWATDANLKDYA